MFWYFHFFCLIIPIFAPMLQMVIFFSFYWSYSWFPFKNFSLTLVTTIYFPWNPHFLLFIVIYKLKILECGYSTVYFFIYLKPITCTSKYFWLTLICSHLIIHIILHLIFLKVLSIYCLIKFRLISFIELIHLFGVMWESYFIL